MKQSLTRILFILEYYQNVNDLPDTVDLEQLIRGYLDTEQFIEKISRSYDYTRNLPLNNLHENYSKAIPEMASIR